MRRPHDARASRQALLDAARALFEQRGYDRSTVREIGDRAEVDPALIARYFGGKEGLYLAALAQDSRPPLTGEPADVAAEILRLCEERGHGPISRALVSTALSGDTRDQARAILHARLLDPLAAELRARGVAEPELRAELLLAVAAGISLTRASGMLATLAEADLDEVLRLLAPFLDALGSSARSACPASNFLRHP